MVTLKVLKKFQDKENPDKIYQAGDLLEINDLDRVNNLVARGICSIVSIKEGEKEEKPKPETISLFDKEFEVSAVKSALIEIGVSINKNAGVQATTNKLSELTEEQNKALSEILCKE